MCDIDKKTRRKRYRKLREAGHTSAFAQRAKDFSNNHVLYHITHQPISYLN